MKAKCANCKKEKDDKHLIYDVPNDRYFCCQKCANAYWQKRSER
jgi:hypothetical protein